MSMRKWTKEEIEFLKEHYPKKGKKWCMEQLNISEGAVRQKAANLGLQARGVSEAWHKKNKEHANILRGRKRPSQALVMKRLHDEGKFPMTENRKNAVSVRMKKWLSDNPHPRGFLGKKHTPEAREVIGKKSIESWDKMPEDKKQERSVKVQKSRAASGNFVQPRKASWKAAWHEIGGKRNYYRSKWESNYAYYLEWLKQKGHIKDWQHEPKIFWFEGIKRGTVSYLPDFCVIENNGEETYHEVKGWMDDRSKTKLKRMAKYHPNVKLILIDRKQYESLRKQVCKFVPGWEE